MKKLVFLVALLMSWFPAMAAISPVVVTGQAVDSDGQQWFGGSYQVILIRPIPGSFYAKDTGNTFPASFSGSLDNTGSFSVNLMPVSNIVPAGSVWQFTVCPQVYSATCGQIQLPINSAGSISSNINAVIVAPRVTGGPGVYAYSDIEVAAIPNNSYFNVTSQTNRCYTNAWGDCGGGGGGGPPTGPAGGSLSGNYPNPGLTPLTSSSSMALFNNLSNCNLVNYVFSPQSGTCISTSGGAPPIGAAGGSLSGTYPNPGLSALTGSATTALFAGLTGCTTPGFILSPQSGTCVPQSGGGGAVASVSAGNSSLTISPSTGAVVAQLNVGNANTWTGTQGFSAGFTAGSGSQLAVSSSGGLTTSATVALNGTSTAVTQSPSDISAKIATTAFVAAATGTTTIATYTNPGSVPPGRAWVYPSQITGSITDAFAAINAAGLTLPASGGIIDATGLGSNTYVVTTRLTALNNANQAVTLIVNPQTHFTVNTVLSSPSNSPASCAIPVGPASQPNGASSIIIPGHNYLGGASFVLGSSASVWDFMCSGSFTGSQESLLLDGVGLQGNAAATMSGALLHIQGVFGPSLIANSGTSLCFGQCVELDSANGGVSTGGGNIQFFNDTFQDNYTGSAIYPGSVLRIDTLTSSGGMGNILFHGGIIQHNGPHNPLIVLNGRGGSQLGVITFENNYWETLSATTSSFWTNVDPVQITDANQIYSDSARIGGNRGSAQAHLIDISTTNGTQSTYAINFEQLSTGVGYTSVIHNTVDGTDETGTNNGGELILPVYHFGGAVASLRFSNVSPVSGACTNETLGSIWTNSTATSNSVSVCQLVSSVATWVSLGGGGSSVLTTLGDILSQNSTGPVRIAGNTSSTIGFFSETGNGAGVSALGVWTPGNGSGNVALTVSPQFVSPYIENATGLSLELMGPYFGLHGAGVAIFTAGATAQVGTGGSLSAPVAVTGTFADTYGGEVTFTTGATGITGPGVIFTAQFPGLWTTVPTCTASIRAVPAAGAALQPFMELSNTSGTVTGSYTVDVALAANTTYHAAWGVCDGQ